MFNLSRNSSLTNMHEDSEFIRTTFSIIVTFVIMLGIGCALDITKIVEHFKKPVALIVGLACQWALMPSLAYFFVRLLSPPSPEALSILIMGSCPGGMGSNIATYFLHGDINLSVALTTSSMITSLGMLPLLLFIFNIGYRHSDDNISVPYSSLGMSIASLVVPLAVGLMLRWKFPQKSKHVLRFGTIIGTLGALAMAASSIVFYSESWSLKTEQILAATFLPLSGIILSYVVASMISLNKRSYLHHKQRRTISIEIGIQNPQIAISIIQMSNWPLHVAARMVLLPLAYGVSQLCWTLLYVAIVQIYHNFPFRTRRQGTTDAGERSEQGHGNLAYVNVEV